MNRNFVSRRFVALIVLGLHFSEAIKFYCEYATHTDYGFGCEVSFINLTSDLRTDDVRFSGTVDQFKRVTFFHIRESRVEYLPEQISTYFANMKNLAIWDSKLDLKQGNLFRQFSKLEVLSLSNNEIDSIDESTFQYMEKLELIELQNNNIEILSGNIFKKHTKLKYVSFKSNNIYLIDPQIFGPLTQLEVVDFGNNICAGDKFMLINGDLSALKTGLRKCFENFYLTRYISRNQEKELNRIEKLLSEVNDKLSLLNSNPKSEEKIIQNESIDRRFETIKKEESVDETETKKPMTLTDIIAKTLHKSKDQAPVVTENYDDVFKEMDFEEPAIVTPKIQMQLWGSQNDVKILQPHNQIHDTIINKYDEILGNRLKPKKEPKPILPVYPEPEIVTTPATAETQVTSTTFDPFYYEYEDESFDS